MKPLSLAVAGEIVKDGAVPRTSPDFCYNFSTMDEKLPVSPFFPLQAAIFEGSLTVVAVALGWLLARPPLETYQVSPGAVALGLAGVLPMLVLFALCLWLPLRPFSAVLRVLDETLIPLFKTCNLVEMAVISLLAGLGEEMLFRGVLQGALADWLGSVLPGGHGAALAAQWLAAIGIAILFGLMHAVNSSYALLSGLIGLYLGWLWMATGNLAVPITTHAVYDFLALAYLVRLRRS